jgi:SAM-dependent methyltransferase
VNLEEYRRMFEAEESHWWYAGMRSISFALLGSRLPAAPPQGRRILDAGCGTGNNLRHLSGEGRAYGLDLSEEALRFCRERGVTAVRGRVGSLPYGDGVFDCVTSFDVLYHRWVENDQAAVREMARVLRPGGVVLIRLPAFEWLRRAHDDAVHTRHRYTRGEVRRLLEGAGLTVLHDTYCNTLLLPIVLLRSALDSVFATEASDLSRLPRLVERAFRGALACEASLVRHVSLPLGASVMGVARKPAAVPDQRCR